MCPYYLSIGMPYDLYWEGHADIVKAFRRAEEERIRSDNFRMWRMGMYVTHAVGTALANAFRKEGSTSIQYTSEPFPVFESDAIKKREDDERMRMEKMYARMEAKLKTHKQMDFSEQGEAIDGRSNDK